MMIGLSGSTPPTEQIRDQIRGLIVSGQLAAGERLPSVRQLAKDLDLAPGTVAKAYKALEGEGFLTARTSGGTRVSRSAATTSQPVLNAARQLVDTSTQAGTNLEDAIRILRAIWPQPRIHTRESDTHVDSAAGDTSENRAQEGAKPGADDRATRAGTRDSCSAS